jgi:hypothetical protein
MQSHSIPLGNRRLAFEHLESRNLLANNSGPALFLDGFDNYASATDAASRDLGLTFLDDFTIEASFYAPSDLARDRPNFLVGKPGAFALSYRITADGSGILVFDIWPSGGGPLSVMGSYRIDPGWHHIAGVFDNENTPTSDLESLYFDGNLINFVPFDLPGVSHTSSLLSIGNYSGSYWLHGYVDEVRLSNTTRYAGTFYMMPAVPFTSDANTRGLWHFDETIGSTAFEDGSGNGNRLVGLSGAHTAFPPGSDRDFGDAPDSLMGVGVRNYSTTSNDNGPSHRAIPGLRLGVHIDADSGALQNSAANADDVDEALPDDEDGLVNHAADLILTVGAQPKVNLRVTNTTGAAATLYGWIDYNANGEFENAAERAFVAVPDGTHNSIVLLVFPVVPSGFTGNTFARFRLSSDAAAAHSTGQADNGEVEDYQVAIIVRSEGIADSAKSTKIAHLAGGGPSLVDGDFFGRAIASVGDFDGDGLGDLVIGAPADDTGGGNRGALYVLFMNSSGTVKSRQKIASGVGGGPNLDNGNAFGSSVASIGDLNGDGVTDLAVGAERQAGGAVYVLYMNADGTAKEHQKIASGIGGGPFLASDDHFGHSVTSLGDLDGDGVTDLAVGAHRHDISGMDTGAVYVLLMNSSGTAKSSQRLGDFIAGQNRAYFGSSVASLGDLDGDGIADLAVGAPGDSFFGYSRGAVHILFMNPNGSVKTGRKIPSGPSDNPLLEFGGRFGTSAASLGDLDGDGVEDLAVGAYWDNATGFRRGALYILFMNANGSVKGSQKIAAGVGGGPGVALRDYFGGSVASLGDLDGDGAADLAVGAHGDYSGSGRGAVHMLFLRPTLVPGDFDGDGSVSTSDHSLWRSTFGSTSNTEADGNRNGAVDAADYVIWRKNLTQTPITFQGDYNRDRSADAADHVIWRKTLSKNVPNGTGADGNGDGVVNDDDYGVWRENFGHTLSESAARAALAIIESPPDSNSISENAATLTATPSLVAGAINSIESRNRSSRAAWRPQTATVGLRVDALPAWSALSPYRARFNSPSERADPQEMPPMGLVDVRSDLTDKIRSPSCLEAWDCAIELLGM